MKEYQYCKRCGRKLKSTVSRQVGFGPTCLSKQQVKVNRLFNLTDKEDAKNASEVQ